MMGIKERAFRPLPSNLSLEELVSKDNFYRSLEERLDLSFLRELVADRYTAMGRTSIDPVVFFQKCASRGHSAASTITRQPWILDTDTKDNPKRECA